MIEQWEYDVKRSRIVWATFDPPEPEVPAAAARLAAKMRNELCETQSLGMDWWDGYMARIAGLLELAASHA